MECHDARKVQIAKKSRDWVVQNLLFTVYKGFGEEDNTSFFRLHINSYIIQRPGSLLLTPGYLERVGSNQIIHNSSSPSSSQPKER